MASALAHRDEEDALSAFAYRHRRLLQDLAAVGAMAGAERLNGLTLRPLGIKTSPALLALGLSLGATWIAGKRRARVAEDTFAALSVGFASGILIKAITNEWPRS